MLTVALVCLALLVLTTIIHYEALRGLAAASERALFDRSENYDLPGTWADEVAAVTAALTAQARAQAQSHQRRNARPRRAARS